MRVDEFDYELPAERIAQSPTLARDASRLLALDRRSDAIEHRAFGDLVDLLRAGDLLVVNDTRVVPARLVGRKPSGGRVELLLVERLAGADAVWRCLLRASRKPEVGLALDFGGGLAAEIAGREGDRWRVRFAAAGGDVETLLEALGRVPLPPYIRRGDGASAPEDRERYQTVYARNPGAVAAPTAGLHFTHEMLEAIRRRGVAIEALTLHVGPATFEPVRVENVEEHVLAAERVELPAFVAEAVCRTRRDGGRVVAVGTTVVRALEGRADEAGGVAPGVGDCRLFIYPGHRFRVVDALVTNFHLPRSTLLMLVAAFAGRERLLAAYREAVRAGYRFYSYGDAMWVA